MKLSAKDFADQLHAMADKVASGDIVLMTVVSGRGDCLWMASNGQNAYSSVLSIEYRTDMYRAEQK